MKTILITGATSGIGKETAKSLLLLGHRVIIVGRDSDTTRSAFEELRNLSTKVNAILEYCDLADLEQIKDLASRIKASNHEINVLINNAGLEMATRQVSTQGLELTWAVNYLAPVLLTELLLPTLLKNPGSRVVMTSSLVEKWGKLNFDDLQMLQGYDPEKAYYRSKLALLMYSIDLANRYSVKQLTVNTFEPGMTKTNFTRNFQGIMKLFQHSATVPAKTAVYLAVSPDVANITGTNFENLKVKQTSNQSHDENLIERLMIETRKELKI